METQIAKRARIFLVDDSAPIRARLVDILSQIKSVTVVGEADTAASAVEGITRTRPQCVVLDIRLLGGSGIDVLREIKPLFPEIIFIMLTNQAEQQYRKACLANGASYFLDKSREFTQIRALIQDIHARPHATSI